MIKKQKSHNQKKKYVDKSDNVESTKKYFYKSILFVLIGLISFIFDKVIIQIISAVQYPLLFQIFYYITLLGEGYMFLILVVIIVGALIMYRKPITTLLVATGLAGIVSWSMKSIINRPRPFEAAHINSLISTSMSSFPSGHTLSFFSIVPVLSKNFPKIKIVVWTIAILVGISRIYLGVHYFSDVVCGAIIGYSIGWLALKIGENYAWKY